MRFGKGSAEALVPLLHPDSVPEWYNGMHTTMAEKGMRVWRLHINGTKANHCQNKIFAKFQEKKLKVL